MSSVCESIDSLSGLQEDLEHDLKTMLVKLLVLNRQFELAESVAEKTEGRLRTVFSAKVAKGRMAHAFSRLSTMASRDQSLELKHLTNLIAGSNSHKVVPSHATLNKLLSENNMAAATQLVDSIPADMGRYQFKSGSYGLASAKMRGLALIAADHFRTGQRTKAEHIIQRFGVANTRDQVRLNILQECLRKEHQDLEIAELMLAAIESDKIRFWAGFRLANHAVRNDDLERSVEYTGVMQRMYDAADPRSRIYLAGIQICNAQLMIEAGRSGADCLKQATQIAGNRLSELAQIAAVQAWDGDWEAATSDEQVAYFATMALLDLKDMAHLGYPPPLRNILPAKRLEIAEELAQRVTNGTARAMSQKLIARNCLERDPEHAKSLLDLALESARSESEPFLVRGRPVDQFQLMSDIGSIYATGGWPADALAAAMHVPIKETPSFAAAGPKNKPYREIVLTRICRELTISDRAFVENDGAEIFEFLDVLANAVDPDSENPMSRITIGPIIGKFAELGEMQKAERAFDISRNQLGLEPNVPYAICVELVRQEDARGFENWFQQCPESRRQSFLTTVCCIYNEIGKAPNVKMLSAIEKRVDLKPKSQFVFACLLMGHEANGDASAVNELLGQLEFNTSSTYMRILVAAQAAKCGLSRLFLRVVKETDDPNMQARVLMQNVSQLVSKRAACKLFEELIDQESELIQVAAKLGIAQAVLFRSKESQSSPFKRTP